MLILCSESTSLKCISFNMTTTKKLTLSHKHAFRLQHLLSNREIRGWKRDSDVYIDDGMFCVDISIEAYVTIYHT
ncbi:hypothetical protein VAEU17_3190037 [Vibrio aestuarianus]|nr:hypothetical protein VAEU17_3190037 [Vibrio aestuarianus]